MNDHRFMLDANIITDLIRNPRGKVNAKLRQYGINSICLSAIVASEVRFGLAKRGSQTFTAHVEEALSRIAILDYGEDASFYYAAIRYDLQKQGSIIGATDLFIAAHAQSLGLTLVTNNVREFSRIDGLKIENWLEETRP